MKRKPENEMTCRDLEIGLIATEPGSSKLNKTGGWRSNRPTYDFKKCIKCGMCYMYCPEASIIQNADGYFVADFDYCKGCGICAMECPTKSITMVEEKE